MLQSAYYPITEWLSAHFWYSAVVFSRENVILSGLTPSHRFFSFVQSRVAPHLVVFQLNFDFSLT